MIQKSASSSRKDRFEAARAEILEAAAAAIAENGYYGMTMRGLARATGRALANFYNYFSSKEDLLFALQADAFETLNESVEQALTGTDNPAERLYVFIFNHLRYVAEHRDVMRVVIHEASALPAGRRKTVRTLKERYYKTGLKIVESILCGGCGAPGAQGSGRPDETEIERATYGIFGMLNWSYGWYDPSRHGSPHDVARTIHGIALCGLVARCPYRAVQKSMERYLAAIAPPPLIGGHDRHTEKPKRLSH